MRGTDMDVQKLRQFQVLLMKKKFSNAFDKMDAFDKMNFIANVQFKCAKDPNPEIILVVVADTSIHLDHGCIIVPKNKILKIESDNNHVVVKLKTPMLGFGSFLSFDFIDSNKKQEFLDAIGEIEDYASDDSSEDSDKTPPSSSDSSD